MTIEHKTLRNAEIKNINKDTFWDLIAQAKEQCGRDLQVEAEYIKRQLYKMEPEQSLRFHHMVHHYSKLADKYGLWSAAAIMCQGCTDDGFIDFRAWLIAQGKTVYLAALKDPDSLADVEPYGNCCFEDLGYIGDFVYEEKTRQNAYEAPVPADLQAELSMLKKDIFYGMAIDYPMEWAELETYLPKLCAKHLGPFGLSIRATWNEPLWNPSSPSIQQARKRFKAKQRGDQHQARDGNR